MTRVVAIRVRVGTSTNVKIINHWNQTQNQVEDEMEAPPGRELYYIYYKNSLVVPTSRGTPMSCHFYCGTPKIWKAL